MNLTRRLFLVRSVALAATVYAAPRFKKNPFSLGVMSGDPSPDGFVLWTRLAPDPLNGGGMHAAAVEVDWIVAEDEGMRRVVKKGKAVAAPALAHSVHVDVNGLKSQRPYWYRFKAGTEVSPVGRASTAPATRRGELAFEVRFRVLPELGGRTVDCVRSHAGGGSTTWWFIWATTSTRALPSQRRCASTTARRSCRSPTTATGMRSTRPIRPSRRCTCTVRGSSPGTITKWTTTTRATYPRTQQPRDAFLERRANAYQAYYEHMPLRMTSLPHGSSMQMYRRVPFGEAGRVRGARYAAISHRSALRRRNEGACEASFDPKATILGDAQEAWLKQTLDKSPARWNIIANQVLMARIDQKPGPDEALSMDQWSGYEVCRDRVMKFLAGSQAVQPDRDHRRHPLQLGQRPEGGLEG